MKQNVVLIGMPGSGKTVVGREVAARLGWPLLDTDDLIARRTGRPIARLFRDGEAAFRQVERAVVREAAATRPAVIATGGGVVLDRESMSILRQHGIIISLKAPAEVLARRLGPGGAGRPLLAADPQTGVRTLLAEREAQYEDADVILNASQALTEVVHAVLRSVAARARDTVMVEVGHAPYPVRIGVGNLDLLGWEVGERLGPVQGVLLTHPRLWRLFGARLERVMAAAGLRVLIMTIGEGEASKSLRRASAVFDRMAAAGFDRTAVVMGLGGGVIGDLSGFVAGTYMRGIALVHLPTTLLAQVDSAVGGKAAVNHPRAKNLIGVFHQPALVVADIETLRTLPLRAIRSGLAEVIKYGMVCDARLLAFVERHLDALLDRDGATLRDCVRWCVEIKAQVVREDEWERGPRRLLNYGHTVGHALELLGHGGLTHGEAIAIGMSVEAWLATRLGLLDEAIRRRQEEALRRVGLPTRIPQDRPGPDELLQVMRLDKKVMRGALGMTLPKDAGVGLTDQVAPEDALREALLTCRASS